MPKTTAESLSIFETTTQIPASHWNAVVPNTHVFLSLAYLSALENTLRDSLKLIYVIFYSKEAKPVLAGVFQITTFTYKKATQRNLFLKLFQDCHTAEDNFELRGLVCGNMFATGNHGFAHTTAISEKTAHQLLAKAAKKISKDARWENLFKIILFKEFWPPATTEIVLEDYKYRPFQIDVAMVLHVHPNWKTMEDYLASMKAKYRTKANSAYKKSSPLIIKSLTSEDILLHQKTLQMLFNTVQQKSNYTYGENYPASFFALKSALGEAFCCKGVFLNDRLIAFSTAFETENVFEANYVGLDYAYNLEFAVYERLLYEYVQEAISRKLPKLNLGRTSELIKSALGAIPVPLKLFARHTSALKNVLVRPILENLGPTVFELRTPFLKPSLHEM